MTTSAESDSTIPRMATSDGDELLLPVMATVHLRGEGRRDRLFPGARILVDPDDPHIASLLDLQYLVPDGPPVRDSEIEESAEAADDDEP
jgi:hypothetical protein